MTEIPINGAAPEIMHIDLNACFAMTEQQANPLLRHRPVAVTNRMSTNATIVAPSYEAKRLGIKCGTKVADARRKAPGIIVLEADPLKYKFVHQSIRSIFAEYCPDVRMKSIDEGVLDFRRAQHILRGRSLESVGREIKNRVRNELGDWMTINVGIGPSSFLAKLAASLNKPDGLDIIDRSNVEGIYLTARLTDLTGINRRFRNRLLMHGITNPYEFLLATERKLSRQVFRSVGGHHWYWRLRGYEVDDIAFRTRQVGKQFVLPRRTDQPAELLRIINELAYFISRRLQKHDLSAGGLILALFYTDGLGPRVWISRKLFSAGTSSLLDLQHRASILFAARPNDRIVSQINLVSYNLSGSNTGQLPLYGPTFYRTDTIGRIINEINDRFGDFTLATANIAANPKVPDKIAFGSVRYF